MIKRWRRLLLLLTVLLIGVGLRERASAQKTSPSALLVVGSTTLSSSDTLVAQRLSAFGYTVVPKTGAATVTTDASGMALVVVSSSAPATDVGSKFRSASVPVIVCQPGVYGAMGLTGSTASDSGGVSDQAIVIVDASQPLAAGLSGTVAVASTPTILGWGVPAIGATYVASAANGGSQATIFSYESGAPMAGLAAPARRVGFFLSDATTLTANGWSLFDAAVGWSVASGSTTQIQAAVATSTPTATPAPIRIEAGGTANFTDHNGNIWLSDRGFTGGGVVDRGNITIANTLDPKIYQTEHYSATAFAYTVPNGPYQVNLHFCETYTGITGAGQRVFSANVEGTAISNIDVYAQAGGRNIALIKTVNVNVADGQLNIALAASVNNTEINGIEIIALAPTPTSTPTATATNTPSPTPSATSTPSPTPSATLTPTVTPSPTATTPAPTATSTATATALATATSTATATATNTATPTSTATPTPTSTATSTATPRPTSTSTATATNAATATVTNPPTATPSATGTATATATATPAPVRIEAGGTANFTDHNGNVWLSDRGFTGGGVTDRGNITIANTLDPKIYQTEHYGATAFAYTVPNGTYQVNLHFCETYTGITGAGQRVFSVNVEGTAINNIDVYALTGGRNIALIKTVTVTVADGQLNMTFTASVNSSEINGVEILSSSPTATPSATATSTATVRPTSTNSPTATATATSTATATPRPTATATATVRPRATATSTSTPRPTPTPRTRATATATATPRATATPTATSTPTPLGPPVVAGGRWHSMLRTTDGTVYEWGMVTTSLSPLQPTLISGLSNITAVAGGRQHTLARRSDGAVLAFGWNQYGQLGNISTTDSDVPVLVQGPSGALASITAVAAGSGFSVALKSDGSVWTWGDNSYGALGLGASGGTGPQLWAQRVVDPADPSGFLTGITKIAAGSIHVLALKSDGTVRSWGDNYYGELGDGTSSTWQQAPVTVPGLTGVLAISAGDTHSLALKSDGTVWAWGTNYDSALGDGTGSSRTPVKVKNPSDPTGYLTGVSAIAAGGGYSLALKGTSLLSWGSNSNGVLGQGSISPQPYPAPVTTTSGLSSVSQMAAGLETALAVAPDGSIWAWGGDSTTGVGDGTANTSAVPVMVMGPGTTPLLAGVEIAPAGGTYNTDQTVTLSCVAAGATIHYTTNGADPTTSDPVIASGGTITVDQTMTIAAKAFLTGSNPSPTNRQTYTMAVAPLTFSLPGGTYASPPTVTISTTTPGVSIRYTTDGTTPSQTSALYTAPLTLNTATTLNAVAYRTGWTPSPVRSATYVMAFGPLPTPAIDPPAGTYTGSVVVSLSSLPGATIRYTTDGTNPASSPSAAIYTSPLTFTQNTTLAAMGSHPDYTPSAITTAIYKIQLAPPTFSPDGGSSPAGTHITLSAAPGATIRYTLNGVDPTASDPVVPASGTITIGNYTLKAKAFASGGTALDSAVKTAAYTATGASAVRAIAAADRHSAALDADGTVWWWGSDSGLTTDPSIPARLAGLTGVKMIAAGGSTGLAIREDGTLWAWGGLGDGVTSKPVLIMSNAIAASAGYAHALAVKSDGTVWAWGSNSNLQLGPSGGTGSAVPVQVTGLAGAIAVQASASSSAALLADGTVWTWGGNSLAQLGDGTTNTRANPLAVNISNIVEIAGGGNSLLALRNDGVLFGWGSNVSRNLAGTVSPQTSPIPLALSGVAHIAGSSTHTLAITGDGSVWAWGDNSVGAIGSGGASGLQTSPVQLSTPSNVVQVAAGSNYPDSLALTADGSVWAWGSNAFGKLGDGTAKNRATPIQISLAGMKWKTATPTFSIPSGTYTNVQTVVLSSLSPGAVIYYTTNGNDPTTADLSVPSGGTITVDHSLTLKAKAVAAPMPESNVETIVYTLQVVPPVASPVAGTYINAQNVTLATSTTGATIRYTTDGTAATSSSPLYTGPFVVNASTVVNAYASLAGWSPVTSSASYTLKVDIPTLSPANGDATSVQVFERSVGAELHYTLNGADPTLSDPIVASGGSITIDHPLTLKVKGFATGWTSSVAASGSYFPYVTASDLAPPVLSPTPGTFTTPQTVSLSTTTAGATIRYTTDGTAPTIWSPIYHAPFPVNRTMTINAQTFLYGYGPSTVTSGTYTLNLGTVASPILSPAGGFYPVATNVTVSCATANATIRYTTTGADPTTSDPVIASGSSVRVDHGMVLKAKAWLNGTPASPVQSEIYVLTGAIAAALDHSLALRSDGTVLAWGANNRGQLGIGSTTNALSPVAVTGPTNVVAIATADNHSLAVTAQGQLWTWGDNLYGELGDGTSGLTPRVTPALVSGISGVIAAAGGLQHSLALKNDGTVWEWGNTNGSLVPVPVNGLTNVVAIAAGTAHNLALKRDGTVWTWGTAAGNTFGQLGDGTTSPHTVPARSLLSGVTSIAAVYDNSSAVRTDGAATGAAWAWGTNASGQVGGSYDSGAHPVPVEVAGTVGALRTAVGAWVIAPTSIPGTALSLQAGPLAQNTVLGWAANTNGQLENAVNPVLAPVPLARNIDGIMAIAAGGAHSLALRADGSVWAWGANGAGQLGDGTTTSRPTSAPSGATVSDGWGAADPDQDGLTNAQEALLGTDPYNADTNGDGIPDGVAFRSGISATDSDMDHDGLTNAQERALGTDPTNPDTDGDGVIDGLDCFPLDPARSQCPAVDPLDHTPPVITLAEPVGATLISTVP